MRPVATNRPLPPHPGELTLSRPPRPPGAPPPPPSTTPGHQLFPEPDSRPTGSFFTRNIPSFYTRQDPGSYRQQQIGQSQQIASTTAFQIAMLVIGILAMAFWITALACDNWASSFIPSVDMDSVDWLDSSSELDIHTTRRLVWLGVFQVCHCPVSDKFQTCEWQCAKSDATNAETVTFAVLALASVLWLLYLSTSALLSPAEPVNRFTALQSFLCASLFTFSMISTTIYFGSYGRAASVADWYQPDFDKNFRLEVSWGFAMAASILGFLMWCLSRLRSYCAEIF